MFLKSSLMGPDTTGLSPSLAPPSRGIGPCSPLRTPLQTTIQKMEPPDSKDGLFLLESLSMVGSRSPNTRRAVAATAKRVELQPPLATSIDVESHLGQSRARGECEASIRPAMEAQPMIKFHSAMVLWCHGAMVPWWHGALVLWCYGAMVIRCMVPWYLCAMVLQYLGAMVLRCLSAMVLRCHGAMVPRFLGAFVLWCFGAMVPWCLGAIVPW
ncbi:hypothetical protein CQW23_32057 [Capsicum baccatum]|uniref:Uncharacterized protein n=1 Tax=Capsicum baccatum TaxID=33114 RepID=A0A2G2V5T4_CAPBA|nr:hypothetical protein CQW23_32057 [Capsicum baccatum]